MTATSATLPGNQTALPGRREPVPTRSSSYFLKLALRASLAALTLGGVAFLTACEDKAIGRVCETRVDAGQNELVLEPQALECPSRVCLRPARDLAKSEDVDTTSLCTAECSKDSDCDGAETRNASNSRDKRCKSGFVCGVARVTGTAFCCKKLCMCKDFLVIPPSGLETPAVCNKSLNPGVCPIGG
jgi:hypothetical protein